MKPPTLDEIRASREMLDPYIVETPVWHWRNRELEEAIAPGTQVFAKLELFQQTGTFKPRGALRNMLGMDPAALERGVTAVSAGNHAIAVGYAAKLLGSSAKVVMPKSANPARVAKCESYGADIVLVEDVYEAFERVVQIEEDEGRTFVHPYEGPLTILGTATVGLEFCQQVPELNAVVIPIGGGGLCAGMATAIKQLQPQCQVFGIEPEGADAMYRSFQAGEPRAIDKVETIADSLGAPRAEPYSFSLCYKYVDDLVLLSDDQIRAGMSLLFRGMKIAAEPAGATATAALMGPLRERLAGQRVGVIVCGSNIDVASFSALVS